MGWSNTHSFELMRLLPWQRELITIIQWLDNELMNLISFLFMGMSSDMERWLLPFGGHIYLTQSRQHASHDTSTCGTTCPDNNPLTAIFMGRASSKKPLPPPPYSFTYHQPSQVWESHSWLNTSGHSKLKVRNALGDILQSHHSNGTRLATWK